MTGTPSALGLIGGVGLLERAINYTLGCLHTVSTPALSCQSPCAGWDVRALLCHLDDSLLALYEAADPGRIALRASTGFLGPDPIGTVRNRARDLVGVWANTDRNDFLVSVAGIPLAAGIVTGAGAIEAAVHGWDLARACGRVQPIPPRLAADLLSVVALVVGAGDRPGRFAAPVEIPGALDPGDRLLAYLGRDPR